MGDGMTNSPFDLFMYFLIFGGIPALLVFVPMAAISFLIDTIRDIRNRGK